MELSGKVIIFESEEEAIFWFKCMQDVEKEQKLKQMQFEIERIEKELKYQNEVDKLESD